MYLHRYLWESFKNPKKNPQVSTQSVSDTSQFCGCLYQGGVTPC